MGRGRSRSAGHDDIAKNAFTLTSWYSQPGLVVLEVDASFEQCSSASLKHGAAEDQNVSGLSRLCSLV